MSVRPTRADLALAVALAAAATLVYAPVVGFGFVSFDDPGYVTRNTMVQRGLSWEGLPWAFSTFRMANWHPLTWLSHMADVSLFGSEPGGHHATNAALHALNSALLFLALRALTGRRLPAAVVAALFAVHPLRVESVAWISQRKDVLAGSFFCLVLWTWARAVAAPSPSRRALAFTAHALGLLAKPTLVSVPFVLLLLDFWPLRRAAPWRKQAAADGLSLRALVREKLPFFLLSAASCAVTLLGQSSRDAVSSLSSVPLDLRLTNASLAVVTYLRKALWPHDLAYYYPLPVAVDRPLLLRAALALVCIALITAAVRTRRAPACLGVGWLWFLGMLVPMLGLVQVGSQSLADRYAYLSLVGLQIAVVYGLAEVAALRPRLRPLLAALAVAAIAGYGTAAARQVWVWEDTVRLAEHALAVTERNAMAHTHLGLARRREDDGTAARAEFTAALAIEPRFAPAWVALADLDVQEGRLAESRASYERALSLDPSSFEALYGLASVLAQGGEFQPAAALYERVLQVRPRSAEAHTGLGFVLLSLGDRSGAVRHFEEALRLDSDLKQARAGLRRAGTGRP